MLQNQIDFSEARDEHSNHAFLRPQRPALCYHHTTIIELKLCQFSKLFPETLLNISLQSLSAQLLTHQLTLSRSR